MKRSILFSILLLLTICTLGQSTDSTATVTYTAGDTILEFLSKNAWSLALGAFFILSEWLGNTKKVKENSVIAWIINFAGNLIKKKAVVAKVIFIALILSAVSFSASAQNKPFKGFFKPVEDNIFEAPRSMGAMTVNPGGAWLFRPAVTLTALQLTPTKEAGKVFDVTSFRSVGMGLSYQHFINLNGNPYTNYGFNLFLLLDAIPTETTAINISPAVTVSALQFINLGAGYNLGQKKPFLLAGISYNFN